MTEAATNVVSMPISEPIPPLDNIRRMISVLERTLADPSIPLDRVERMYAMIKETMAMGAEMAFNNAMAAAQAEMPHVFRDASNQQTQSRYATLEAVITAISPTITKYGFGPSFDTFPSTLENHYGIKCHLNHKGGATRTYQVDVPADLLGPKGTPNKSATHGFGSTMTYGRRYLLLLIFNVALTNEDNDGVSTAGKLSAEQAKEIKGMLTEKGAERVCKTEGVERIEDIAANRYETVKARIAASIEAQEKKAAVQKQGATQ